MKTHDERFAELDIKCEFEVRIPGYEAQATEYGIYAYGRTEKDAMAALSDKMRDEFERLDNLGDPRNQFRQWVRDALTNLDDYDAMVVVLVGDQYPLGFQVSLDAGDWGARKTLPGTLVDASMVVRQTVWSSLQGEVDDSGEQ